MLPQFNSKIALFHNVIEFAHIQGRIHITNISAMCDKIKETYSKEAWFTLPITPPQGCDYFEGYLIVLN